MTKQQHQELLLERYEKLKLISNSNHKQITIYVDRNSGERILVKMQEASIMKDSKQRNILHEASFLQNLQGYRGIPFLIWSGKTKYEKIILLVEELGDALSRKHELCNSRFSLKSVCMLGVQMLGIVKTIHDKGYIIGNVSIDIFQFGRRDKCLDLFVNDLSECMVYRDFKTMAHILTPNRYSRSSRHIFESSAVYRNLQKSRRDDIESIIFILIYLLKGSLPWSQSWKDNRQPGKLTQKFVSQFQNVKLICEGTPKQFADMLQDCRGLKFEEEPPYHWYILKLKSMLYSSNEIYDYVYDWMLKPQSRETYSTQRAFEASPNICLDRDQQLIDYLEQKVFPFVDLDEINSKYSVMYAGKKQELRSVQSVRQAQDQIVNLDAEVRHKSNRNQDNKDKLNTSIIERRKHNKEQECNIM